MQIEYPIRLQAYLAKCGVGSRRSNETLIQSGRIRVNNVRVTEMGYKVNEGDIVYLDDILCEPETKDYYFALNKPKGFICSNYDPNETAYARDLIDIEDNNLLFNIGRLDKDSQGLILFTNDGDFANLIMHPSSETEKEYLVKTDKDIFKRDMECALRGEIPPYRIKSYKIISKREVKVVLTEGKNREIRNLFYDLGYDVKRLERIRIGEVELGDLKQGKYRKLKPSEFQSLKDHAKGVKK